MSLDDLKPLLDWLQANPNLAGLFVFILSFFESLAIVGIVIPGAIIMPAIGSLIGSGILPGFIILAHSALGGIAGDLASYGLGRYYQDSILELWPFSLYPSLLEKGKSFFKHHGSKSVFIGRFIGPMRSIVPLMAGILHMPFGRFILTSCFAASLWAFVYMLPGILIGALSAELAPHTTGRLLTIILIFSLISLFGTWMVKHLFQFTIDSINRMLDKLWRIIQKKPSLRFIKMALEDPLKPESHWPLVLFFYFMLSVIAFMSLIGFLSHPFILEINNATFHLFQSLRTTTFDKIMVAIVLLGQWHSMAIVLVTLSLWFTYHRNWRTAIHWLNNGIFALGIAGIAKTFIFVVNPPLFLAAVNSHSFPSDSVSLSTAILGFLAALFAHELPLYRKWFYGLASLLVVLISLSSLYLGIHWLSDIIGGILIGLISATLTSLSYHRHARAQIKPIKLIVASLIILTIMWASALHYHYAVFLNDYKRVLPTRSLIHHQWWRQGIPSYLLIRNNRLGKPVQTLNIQWAGSLAHIESALIEQGWQIPPKTNWVVILSRVAARNRELQLPLLPNVYFDYKPTLLMTKEIGDPKRLLVLRLWNVNLTLLTLARPPTSTTLWLGRIEYQRPWYPKWRQHNERTNDVALMPAVKVLEQDVKEFHWKEVKSSCLDHSDDADCTGSTLLLED